VLSLSLPAASAAAAHQCVPLAKLFSLPLARSLAVVATSRTAEALMLLLLLHADKLSSDVTRSFGTLSDTSISDVTMSWRHQQPWPLQSSDVSIQPRTFFLLSSAVRAQP